MADKDDSDVHVKEKRSTLKFPYSFADTNLVTTAHCRSIIRDGFYNIIIHSNKKSTLTFPSLDDYPRKFRQMVFEHLLDKEVQRQLEEEHTLNWSRNISTLGPLITKQDGNSLCHAASLAMWGLDDSENFLLEKIRSSLRGTNSDLYKRFKNIFQYKWRVENEKKEAEPLETQCDHEWQRLVSIAAASSAAKASDFTEQGISSLLEEFHIFALAYTLQRPIVVYSNCNDTALHKVRYHGIYLPILKDANYCSKDPLPLACNDNGHFSPLICADLTQQTQHKTISLPLCDYYGRILPVKYTLHNENAKYLLENYLNTETVCAPGIKSESPYFTTESITFAKLTVSNMPENLKKLVSEFIDACYIEYIRTQ